MRRALLVLAALLVMATIAGPAGAQEPLLSVADGVYEPGQEVLVTGAGWPAERIVSLQTCGNGGLGGSVHCDQASTRTASSDRSGSFGARLPVGRPPSPCPCTVRAFLVDGPAVDAPIEIAGLPQAPPVPPDARLLEGGLVVEATLEDASSWTAWFGAPPRRTVVLELENRSSQPITWLPIDLAVGRPTRATGVVAAPTVEALAPGESIRLEVPVELPALAVGTYVVHGEVVGHPGTDIRLRTQTAPWGLVAAVGAVVLQLVLVRLRNALARSLAAAGPVADEVQGAPLDVAVVLRDDGEADVVIDLTGPPGQRATAREPA